MNSLIIAISGIIEQFFKLITGLFEKPYRAYKMSAYEDLVRSLFNLVSKTNENDPTLLTQFESFVKYFNELSAKVIAGGPGFIESHIFVNIE